MECYLVVKLRYNHSCVTIFEFTHLSSYPYWRQITYYTLPAYLHYNALRETATHPNSP